MSQWRQNDIAVTANSTTTVETTIGAPIGTYSLVKGSGRGTNPVSMDANAHFGNTSSGSRASVDYNMYANTTVGAFINNMAVGVFAVSASELQTAGGGLILGFITSGGSGYQSNAVVTLTAVNGGTSGVANAHVNVTTNPGRIDSLLISTAGSGYITGPTVAIAAPAAISITANTTGVVAATDFIKITTANSYWQANDRLYYGVTTGNTAIAPLTGNTYYYVSFANTTGIVLSVTPGGANIDLTEARIGAAETGHTFKGDTAQGYLDVGSTYPQVTHSGWVVRREGTGGRAGRVTYETLVAMSSIGISGTTSTGVYGTANVIQSNTAADAIA